jgi:hypothetical protein
MGLRLWGPRVRKFVVIGGSLCGLVLVAMVALWWRLSSGPIELDIATPWLTAAIKENFGAGHDVEIGGTQIERDANGRTSLRIRDIVVRDAEGTIVASAPKAEVGVSGTGLLTGRIRQQGHGLCRRQQASLRHRVRQCRSGAPGIHTGREARTCGGARQHGRATRCTPCNRAGRERVRGHPQRRSRLRRHAGLDREPRRQRPGRPRPRRDRPQGRQSHGR